MRILTAVALLLAVTPGRADDTRLQVTATILSRCEFESARTRNDAQTRAVARCTGSGAVLPYRISDGTRATTASLPSNTRTTIATTRVGQVLTIEF